MREMGVIASAVVLVLAAGGGALAYHAHRAQAAMAKSCEAITSQIAERGEIVHVAGAGPTLTIIGDSYTSGDGLGDYRDAWAYRYVKMTGASADIAGVGDTGYVNGGYCGNQTFSERLPADMGSTLIIQGGLNDSNKPAKAVGAAAAELLATTASVPSVILVGPVDVPGREGEEAVDAALAEAAAEAGRVYVSALDWDISLQPDKVHPDQTGHEIFASNLVEAVS